MKAAVHGYVGQRVVGGAYKAFCAVATVLIYQRFEIYAESFTEYARYISEVIPQRICHFI